VGSWETRSVVISGVGGSNVHYGGEGWKEGQVASTFVCKRFGWVWEPVLVAIELKDVHIRVWRGGKNGWCTDLLSRTVVSGVVLRWFWKQRVVGR